MYIKQKLPVGYFPKIKFQNENPFERMALSSFDTRIMKVVQATHQYQIWNVEGYTLVIYVTYVSLLDIIYKSSSIWYTFDLDWILQKGYLLFKSLNNGRYLGTLSKEFLIECSSVNIEFINNRTSDLIAGACLVSITEIVSDCEQIYTGAVLIINNYTHFRFVLGKPVFFSIVLT